MSIGETFEYDVLFVKLVEESFVDVHLSLATDITFVIE